MEQALEKQLLDQFQFGTVLEWDDLLKKMSSAHGRGRDEVFAAMNTLIDTGKIAMPKQGESYCLPSTLALLKQKEMDGKQIKRSVFDKMSYPDRSAFIHGGGTVID